MVFAVVALVCVTLLAFLYWPKSLAAEARTLLTAAIENRPDDVFGYSPPEEQESTGLTKAKFRKVWNDLVYPRLSKFKHGSHVEASQSGTYQGSAEVQIVSPEGRNMALSASAWKGDDRAVLPVLSVFLMQAWTADYFRRNDVVPSSEHNIRARLEGLAQDKERLKAIGLSGLLNTKQEYATWDELEVKWRSLLRQLEQGKGNQNSSSVAS